MTNVTLTVAQPLFDQVDALLQQYPPTACSAGCSHCCHFPLAATAAEIVVMIEHLAATRTAQELEIIRTAAQGHVDRLTPLPLEEHLYVRTPCPLLSNNQCTAYSVRPLHCRGFHSSDVSHCLSELDEPKGNKVFPIFDIRRNWVATKAAQMLENASREANRDSKVYDFRAALAYGLANKAAFLHAWNHGQDILPATVRADHLSNA